MPDKKSIELPGLTVSLDKLQCQIIEHDDEPVRYQFIYHITIANNADRTVTLLGRKWVVDHDTEEGRQVLEGDKIVGHTPTLRPGEKFSYNSFHISLGNSRAQGSFHGIDENGAKIFTRIPVFHMTVPPKDFWQHAGDSTE